MGRAVLAFDSFQGTASAKELVEAAQVAAANVGWATTEAPLADGGEGSLSVLGGPNRTTVVSGPLGEHVEAGWCLLGSTAYIEMAQASGLTLVGGAAANRALDADTYGTGELIGAAMLHGATTVYVLMGGSATTDGGWGALKALTSKAALKQVDLVAAADVSTNFVDAATQFAPQKGASNAQVRLLTRRLQRLVGVYLDEYGIDVSQVAGAGAAGGLAGALLAVGGRMQSGLEVLADQIDFGGRCVGADLVITGANFLDAESLSGSVIGGVARLAAIEGVPTLAVVGDHDPDLVIPANVQVVSLADRFGREAAVDDTVRLVSQVVGDALQARGPV